MVKRVIDTDFWTDVQVMDHYSVEEKYFSLYLLTNGKSTQVGIYALPKKVMSFETGFSDEVIQVLLDRFSQTYGKILYSEKTQEITYLRSLEFSILSGGKPVRDLLERELGKVKDGELIQATYEAMFDFWQMSKRGFDRTIQEVFENELASRGLFHKQNQKQNQSHNQIHIQSHNQIHIQSHNHNQDSWYESETTNRGANREMIQNEDEDALIEQYATYLKQLKPNVKIELTEENLVATFYAELIGEVFPHVETTLKNWVKIYPKSFVLEALNRSVGARLPIVYAEEILKNWKEKKALSHQDIIRLDKAHSQGKRENLVG